jgi:hypothetical protein
MKTWEIKYVINNDVGKTSLESSEKPNQEVALTHIINKVIPPTLLPQAIKGEPYEDYALRGYKLKIVDISEQKL